MTADHFEDEKCILEGCIKRDPEAWAAFTDKYSGLIYIAVKNCLARYGFRLPNEDFNDIRQNVLASIWKNRSLEIIKNIATIPHWLAVVSGNMALEYIRTIKRHEPQIRTYLSGEKYDEGFLETILSDELNPCDELAKNELAAKITRYIELLPKKEALIIKLYFIHNKKYHEIGEILNLPAGTVSSYAKRGKERLKELLKDFR